MNDGSKFLENERRTSPTSIDVLCFGFIFIGKIKFIKKSCILCLFYLCNYVAGQSGKLNTASSLNPLSEPVPILYYMCIYHFNNFRIMSCYGLF